MASNSGNSTVNLISFILVFLLIAVTNTVHAVPAPELESMLAAVRARGYNLFANAISTSDIHYEVTSGTAFTFFAPINSSLFALDMTTTASDYVTTLRCHVMPSQLSLDDLRKLPTRSSIPTLLQGREAIIERSTVSDAISVDGIRVAVPGLFYGQNLAVHGLGGIISLRSPTGSRQRSSPTINPQPSFGGKQSSNHAPPPPVRFSDQVNPPLVRSSPMSHPPHNFTGTHSPVQVPPPPARPPPIVNIPANLTSIHNSSNMSPPPVVIPGNERIDNSTTAPEPAVAKGFPLSPISPPEISQSSVSIGDTTLIPNDGSRELLSELTSPITYESLSGEFRYSTQTMVNSQPLDEKAFDCPLTDGETGPVDHGYLYTRQHYNVPRMTCHQTYQESL